MPKRKSYRILMIFFGIKNKKEILKSAINQRPMKTKNNKL